MKSIKQTLISGILLLAISVTSLVAFNAPVSAVVNPKEQACIGTGGKWDAAKETCGSNAGTDDLNTVIGTVVNTFLFILGALAVVFIIIGGVRYTISSGNEKNIEEAKNTILYAVIGLVVAFVAYAIVNWVIKAFDKPTTSTTTSATTTTTTTTTTGGSTGGGSSTTGGSTGTGTSGGGGGGGGGGGQ